MASSRRGSARASTDRASTGTSNAYLGRTQ
jgi:hypothetical protein